MSSPVWNRSVSASSVVALRSILTSNGTDTPSISRITPLTLTVSTIDSPSVTYLKSGSPMVSIHSPLSSLPPMDRKSVWVPASEFSSEICDDWVTSVPNSSAIACACARCRAIERASSAETLSGM